MVHAFGGLIIYRPPLGGAVLLILHGLPGVVETGVAPVAVHPEVAVVDKEPRLLCLGGGHTTALGSIVTSDHGTDHVLVTGVVALGEGHLQPEFVHRQRSSPVFHGPAMCFHICLGVIYPAQLIVEGLFSFDRACWRVGNSKVLITPSRFQNLTNIRRHNG